MPPLFCSKDGAALANVIAIAAFIFLSRITATASISSCISGSASWTTHDECAVAWGVISYGLPGSHRRDEHRLDKIVSMTCSSPLPKLSNVRFHALKQAVRLFGSRRAPEVFRNWIFAIFAPQNKIAVTAACNFVAAGRV